MSFLCGSCSQKNNLSLNDRISMSERISPGSNICDQCHKDVFFKDKRINKFSKSDQMYLRI